MKLIIPLFAIANLAAHVVANNFVASPGDIDDPFGRVTCETSEGSPFVHHVNQLIHNLRQNEDDDTCFQDNLGYTDDKCGATIKDYTGKDGGAVFSICSGQIDDDARTSNCAGGPPGEVSCKECHGWSKFEISRMIEAIRNKCNNPHRAGGIYNIMALDNAPRRGGQVRLYTIPASK